MKEQPDYLIPINFTLTERAIERIRFLTERCREEISDPVPAMCWLEWGTDAKGGIETYNVPEIGVYDRSELRPGAIQTISGIELVFSVPPERALEFENRSIDYESDKGFYFADGFEAHD